jgi:DNA-binding MarR family transcriptional regulator
MDGALGRGHGFAERWTAAQERRELRRLAHDLGYVVGRLGAAAARSFLEEFGGTVATAGSDLVHGFRLALVEYMKSYESGRRAADDEEAAEDAAIYRDWQRVLELCRRPRGAAELAGLLDQSASQVSRTLRAMREAGLVEAFPSPDAEERPHRLTPRGERATERVADETCGATGEIAELRRELGRLRGLCERQAEQLACVEEEERSARSDVAELLARAWKYDDKPHQLYSHIMAVAGRREQDPEVRAEIQRLMDAQYRRAGSGPPRDAAGSRGARSAGGASGDPEFP